jgi:hypothetical protein
MGELANRLGISGAGVGIADVGCEEFDDAPPGMFAGVKEEVRHGPV